jgi:hypothetical protein
MTVPVDMKGFAFHVGCTVARAELWGKSPMITINVVTKIKDGKIYLEHSRQPIKFPDRLLIIEQDKLYRMMKQHEIITDSEQGEQE